MTRFADIVTSVRSKNAGPFTLTIDVFCGSPEALERAKAAMPTSRVASILGAEPDTVEQFVVPDISVIKFSLPRPHVQGSLLDRDMHGAQWAVLLAEAEFDEA